MKPRTIIVGLFLALVSAYTAISLGNWAILRHMRAERGWNASQRQADGPELVNEVLPGGPASVLLIGDEVVSINGQNVENSDYKMENVFSAGVTSGDSYSITVRRDGALEEFTLRRERSSLLNWLFTSRAFTVLLAPIVFFLIGAVVFALKPEDKQALLLSAGLIVFASGFSLPQPFEGRAWWFSVLIIFGQVVRQMFPALMLHLFLIFPESSPVLRRRPRLELYLYLPMILLAFPYFTYVMVLWAARPEEFLSFVLRTEGLSNAITLLQIAYIVAALLALIFTYRSAGQVSKRKIRIVLVGSLVSILPLILWLTALTFIPSLRNPALEFIVWPIVNALMLVMPVSFAYAIVRHQVIPISLMIRRSVQYLLAKNALRVLIALPLAGLALTIALNPRRTLDELLLRNSFYFYLLLVAAIVLGLVFRRRLTEWVDRKFFRESYNQEKILRELIDDVKKLDSIPEMSKRVTERVGAALHPEQIYLFYREEGRRDLSLSYTSGGTSQELNIPEEFQLLRFVEMQGGAQDFPFPQKNNLPQGEKEWLAQLGTQLIVPMTGTDARLSGLLLLGRKKSEVPYTSGDRDLLETLAGQIAIVYENVRLKNRVDRERRIKHEVLSRVAGQNLNVLKECPRCGACFDMAEQACTHDGSELVLSLPVERTIEGRYRLDNLLGKGGMGAVYEATDLRLQRKVAVKILTGSMFGNSEALRRFEREAQASGRLHHPNIITVHDYGLLSTEGAYLVMELVRGETLAARIKREGRVSAASAADLFDQILEGIKAAHAASVVHRDLKPENILLAEDSGGRVRAHILDFGLAKLTQAVTADSKSPTAVDPMTTPGAVMGTFGYMSPEQLTGGTVDERSDLFSIGVMVVEALTGRKPFTGKTYHELLTQILQGTFHLQSDSPGTLSLDRALQKCLAKEPRDRYASAGEAQQELIPAIRGFEAPDASEPSRSDADTVILKK